MIKTNITNEQTETLFQEFDIRPTAVRLMIWRQLDTLDFAFALSDLEGLLPTVDRSTIFRALSLFVEKGLLHTIDDGSGQQKYCICHAYEHHEHGTDDCCHEQHSDPHEECQHVHLSCTMCGRTFCLRSQKIPPVQVPEGFQVLHAQYIIQGICPHCAHRSINGHRTECLCHNA